MEIKGIVSAISQKDKGYGVCINNTWFNGFGICPVNKGENILIKYEVNGDFNNIKKIYPLQADAEHVHKDAPEGYRSEDAVERAGDEFQARGEMNQKPEDFGTQWDKYHKKSNGRKEFDKDPIGLAVEVFNQLIDKATFSEETDTLGASSEIMEICCKLVKQAQKAFEEVDEDY